MGKMSDVRVVVHGRVQHTRLRAAGESPTLISTSNAKTDSKGDRSVTEI